MILSLLSYAAAGFSGKNIEGRPAFNEMIDAIKSGARPDYVIAFKLNRFGRDAEVSRFARHREIQ
ncbi:recombinase family protein [Ligilactobacillus ruminis]|uniref:recombinase family protein n=1 Tax=Ligilactobacillus ruminis TaxID=1623 RepID=UPI003A4D21A4